MEITRVQPDNGIFLVTKITADAGPEAVARLSRQVLGYRLDEERTLHTLQVTGMSGGTADIYKQGPAGVDVEHVAGLEEGAAVVISEGRWPAIEVRFSGSGVVWIRSDRVGW